METLRPLLLLRWGSSERIYTSTFAPLYDPPLRGATQAPLLAEHLLYLIVVAPCLRGVTQAPLLPEHLLFRGYCTYPKLSQPPLIHYVVPLVTPQTAGDGPLTPLPFLWDAEVGCGPHKIGAATKGAAELKRRVTPRGGSCSFFGDMVSCFDLVVG